VSYTSPGDSFYVTVFAKNLFDEQYREYAFDLTTGFGSVAANAGYERWYGVTAGFRWH